MRCEPLHTIWVAQIKLPIVARAEVLNGDSKLRHQPAQTEVDSLDMCEVPAKCHDGPHEQLAGGAAGLNRALQLL